MSFRMHLGAPGKKYGLQLPQQQLDDEPVETFEEALAKDAERKRNSKKITNIYENALQEDPTAFDYDGVYDQIHEQRKSDQDRKKEEAQKRQPRYIQAILDKNKERKREQDLIYDRKLQREKEAEGALYGDKEKFITAAYKQKLIEQKKWQEEEAKREEEERRQDVTKKSDLSDFYANLLTNNVAFGTAHTKQPTKTTPTSSKPTQDSKGTASQSTTQPKSIPDQSPKATASSVTTKQAAESLLHETNKEEDHAQTPEEHTKRKVEEKTEDKTEEQKLARRNDDKAVSEARMRYLMRKAAREAEPKPSS